MDESQGYYAEVVDDREFHTDAEDDRFNGFAMWGILAVQGVVWFGIGLMVGFQW